MQAAWFTRECCPACLDKPAFEAYKIPNVKPASCARRPSSLATLGRAVALGACLSSHGLANAAPGPWQYRLIDGSTLTDDCLCGRPAIQQSVRGSLQLRLLEENPLFSRYTVENIALSAGTPPGPHYLVTGHGTYQVGGEVAVTQDLTLELQIDDGFTNRLCLLTNVSPAVNRLWPMLALSLDQSDKPVIQFYRLDLFAAPFQEIWFSTASGLTAGNWPPPTNTVSGGDLISGTGRLVKRNQELTRGLGIMPMVPDLGLDAGDVLPGGEIAFSAEQDSASETLGPLPHGDMLSNRGRVIHRNADLIRPFSPEPPAPDVGVDAAHVRDDGEVWFSTETDIFSEGLGVTVRRGDLLSSSGQIVKLNEDLIARFQPADPKQDYGLDALYVWPSGEIWFSVETGFVGPHFEPYAAGDLLSDQGYVVYRNLELTGAFAPIEDLADFGLDAVFVVTDAAPAATPPRVVSFSVDAKTGIVSIRWEGLGRAFLLEAASDILGPWLPLGPITPDLSLDWTPPPDRPPQSFLRVRQW